MRVGLVCPYSLSVPGGVQGQVLGLARALRAQGIYARVLGPCDGPPPDAAVTPLGNSVPYAANGSMAAIAPDPAATLRTIRALRDEEFDVVHLHEPLAPGPTMTALLFSSSPLLGTFHRAGPAGWYKAAGPFVRWASARLTLRAAVSEEARRTAQESLGGDYELLWNGIDVAVYDEAEPWPSTGEAPTVMFVGRHEPRKGLATLIEAMKLVGSEARLWVAGEGPQTARLRQATKGWPDVEWLGTISEGEKVRRLKASRVLCAPSLGGESFGMVLLEAMAARAAVVASDLPGYANVAQRGEDGILVPPGDARALAAGLERALAGGPQIDEMVSSARARAESFSLRALADRYAELYTEASKLGSPTMAPRRAR